MSYGIVNYFKGGTKEQYDATLEKVRPGKGMPAGELHHVAGGTGDGFMVSVVWESKAAFDKFREGTLLPALAELGDKGLPGPPESWEFEVQNEQHT